MTNNQVTLPKTMINCSVLEIFTKRRYKVNICKFDAISDVFIFYNTRLGLPSIQQFVFDGLQPFVSTIDANGHPACHSNSWHFLTNKSV